MKFLKRWLYGDVPSHEGWQPGEARAVARDVRKASARMHTCANLRCKSRPLSGSMFCSECLEAPRVRVVVIRPKRVSHLALRKIVESLASLERLTGMWFAMYEVELRVAFDRALMRIGCE